MSKPHEAILRREMEAHNGSTVFWAGIGGSDKPLRRIEAGGQVRALYGRIPTIVRMAHNIRRFGILPARQPRRHEPADMSATIGEGHLETGQRVTLEGAAELIP